SRRLQDESPDKDYEKIQKQWLKDLEEFVENSPRTTETSEAMLQLGIAQEFAGEPDKALKWYDEIVKNFPKASAYSKALGAKTRLESVGRNIRLAGSRLGGGKIDLNSKEYRGKVVLIQFWATWCEPCKGDLPQLKDALERFKKFDFAIIGVSLDSS